MKRMICLAALMLQGIASANLFCGNVWVAGEALLLRPSGAYPYAEIVGTTRTYPEGAQSAMCPSYEWGYKVEVGYRLCDREVLINWLSFNNGYRSKRAFDDTAVVQPSLGPTLFQVAISPLSGAILSKDTFKYDALDAELAQWICSSCSSWSTRLFLGLRYARVCHNGFNAIIYNGTLGPVGPNFFSRSDIQGTGPRVGLAGRWDLFCGFGLTGSVAGHLLIGSAKSEFVAFDIAQVEFSNALFPQANVKNRKYCRIIPASEVKFGIDWKGCLFCGFSGELGVGYQITHYFYGDQSTLFTQGPGVATNHVHTDPISFDGWYFRLGLMY